MARNRGKKALYEVMSRARSKNAYGRPPEQPAPQRAAETEPVAKPQTEPSAAKPAPTRAEGIAAKWWRKPRVVQVNAGRIEFSLPYQVAVAAGLVLVLVLLASYRLGQFSGLTVPVGPAPASGQAQQEPAASPPTRAASDVPPPAAPTGRTPPPKTEKVVPAVPAGDNAIVLVHYHTLADLQPVQAHFAEHGIETEIVAESGRYVLQTKQRYVNATARGSDGYNAIQKIKEIGALYKGKAPPGYETFAPNYFSDAYGRKVK